MSERKKLSRELKALWGEVRRERRESAKLEDAAAIAEAADRLGGYASALKKLAEQLGASGNDASEPAASDEKPKRKRAPKKKEKTEA